MFGALHPHHTRTNVPHNVLYFKEGMPPPPAHEDIDPEEMTDEEILEASSGSYWQPPFESSIDFDSISRNLGKLDDIPPVSPADFTSFAFYMPKKGGGYENFSFDERRHLLRPYNSPAKRILLFCGRQVEKSTMIGNRAISRSCLLQDHKTLYVSPSSTQTRTFSIDRLKDPIETSPVLKRWTTSMLMQNVFEKQFINRSKITLRYAFLNPDRTRGIPAKDLLLDEVQDIIADHIPVIEQCTSHFQEESSFLYAGTPKGLDNPLEYYRSSMSTQGEWVVPCDRCGTKSTGRHWNILGEKNIGKKGLICEKCGELINPMHVDAQWAFAVKRPNKEFPFESYRIPQLMVPWVTWDEILLNYRRYPRDKFYNEVLGLSYDSGTRPLTTRQVMECCNPKVTMHPLELERVRKELQGRDIFAGIDWGCHDDQTRILTAGGFKYFRELTDEDKVAQWDPETREMSFVKPLARTVREWDQPLLHFETKGGLDLLVTHTHRMRVGVSQGERWLTESAGQFVERGGNAKFVGHVRWEGKEQETFVLPGIPRSAGYTGCASRSLGMDDWLEFVGYLLTEGGVCFDGDRPSCLKMSQRTPVNQLTADKIKACMSRLGISYTEFPNEETGDLNWTICGKQYWHWVCENIGVKCADKRLPRAFLALGARQLKILFEALVAGDGTRDERENCTGGAFYSTSKGLCEDFQEICIRLGMRCIVRLHKDAEGNHKTRWRALWSRGRDHQFNTPRTSVKRVPYQGKVYCCAVPSGYIVTERNGCISYQGNTGENSYTVLCLGYYEGTKFRIFFIHRFIGEDVDPEPQREKIYSILHAFGVRLAGSDYGGGFDRNDFLVRKMGINRLHKFQYLPRPKKKVNWEPKLRRWMVHRTEIMSDVFNAIKRGQLEFPRWEEFKEPYGQDMLNIFSEYNVTLRMVQYNHRPDRPDDAFHSILLCFLASMLVHKRPDIIAPMKEYDHIGSVMGSDWSPLDQG
jgi:hypothetical protein